MEQLRAEGAANAASTQSIVPDLDLGEPAPAAPNTADLLLDTSMRGPITDVNLDLPPSKPVDSNVIDFEFDPAKTTRVETPNTATFDPDQTMIISPENQEKAQGLDVEIDLSALDVKVPADAANDAPVAPATVEMPFDLRIPPVEPPPTGVGTVPPTDVKLEVPDFKPADTATMDFALDTVSFDLGKDHAHDPTAAAAPVHDDHWYDVQTKFDLAKAYQEMGDKEGAREILQEVMAEGDSEQKAAAQRVLETLA
jgi:pilus assembly protein FimV